MKINQLFFTILFSAMTSTVFCAERPDVIRHDAQYLDRAVAIHVEWQSDNPVTKVNVSAGSQVKEIVVDEYDNKRNPSGYQGEVSVNLPVDPGMFQQGVPYVIQVEDDLRQKSNVVSGKAPVPPMLIPGHAPQQQQEDNWGKSHLSAMSARKQDGNAVMVDKLVGLYDRFDTPPSMEGIKVNILSPDNVSFSTRANDDKSLLEIRVKIFSNVGSMVGFQSISGLGKVWQGTSQPFNLGGGSFRVVMQAIDNAGNTSKEQSAAFQLTGQVKELAITQETSPIPPTLQPAQKTTVDVQTSAPTEDVNQAAIPQVVPPTIQQPQFVPQQQSVAPPPNLQTPQGQSIPGL